jgi:hypothetical protein
MNKGKVALWAGVLACAAGWPAWGGAAAFSADGVVVLRVGDGSAPLTGRLASVFLDEYAQAGQWRQTVALPASSSADALTLRGANGSEGPMSLSGDGQSLTVAGWGLAAGQQRTATTPVRVASVNAAGEVALSTWTGLGSGSSLTAAGGGLSSPWVGTSSLLASFNADGTLGQSVPGGAQDLKSLGGQTWAALAGSGQRPTGIHEVIRAADGSVSLVSVRDVGLVGVSAFAMLDLNADIPGADTLYVATTIANASTGRLQVIKFNLRSSGAWGTGGSFDLPSGASFNGLVARAAGGQVQLMGTTSDTLLSTLDPWGYTEVPKGVIGGASNWTTLATAAPDTTFRGLALSPSAVPEASEAALALTGLGCCLLVARRRQPSGFTASTSSSPRAPAAGGSAPAGGALPSGAGRSST